MDIHCSIPTAKFRLGRIVATPNALERIPSEDITAGITRHQAGDWGEIPRDDHVANDHALVEGTRLVSAYHSAKGVKFRIITEADRSVTTVLLSEDYYTPQWPFSHERGRPSSPPEKLQPKLSVGLRTPKATCSEQAGSGKRVLSITTQDKRTLKIEAVDIYTKHKAKPLIRLTGRWLEAAGFRPGHRVAIHMPKPGELTLRFEEQCM